MIDEVIIISSMLILHQLIHLLTRTTGATCEVGCDILSKHLQSPLVFYVVFVHCCLSFLVVMTFSVYCRLMGLHDPLVFHASRNVFWVF